VRNEHDPVDEALQSLAGRQWPGATHDAELENRLMQEFNSRRSASFVARHRVLVPVLGVLLLGSAVFAAAGGVEMVKGWFVTIEVAVDGDLIAVEDVVLDEEGKGSFIMPEEAMEGKELTLSIEGGPVEVPGEGQVATIDINVAEDNVAEVEVNIVGEDEEKE
jgi:hypothetical protein